MTRQTYFVENTPESLASDPPIIFDEQLARIDNADLKRPLDTFLFSSGDGVVRCAKGAKAPDGFSSRGR